MSKGRQSFVSIFVHVAKEYEPVDLGACPIAWPLVAGCVSGVGSVLVKVYFLLSSLFSYRRSGKSFGAIPIGRFTSLVRSTDIRQLSIHAVTRCSRNRVPKAVGVGILSSSFTIVTSSALRGSGPITLCYHDNGQDGGTTTVLDRGKCGICRLSGKFGT